jgi:enoyl-CoA hydratase/carnithine racemase
MLLAGAEFHRWLDHRGPTRPIDTGERVQVSRSGNTLSIVLNRPARRNAIDAAMRDALRDALSIAEWDDTLAVELSGAGPSFSSGGDLDEFGTADDPPTAHLIRVTASVGAVVHRLRDRTTVRVHGVCMGAGVELPAFAGRVIAAPGTTFTLPEIGMGLIPGAGGTVSIPRRIGAPRALWLALAGTPLDAPTALVWGLVDAIG